MKLVYMDVQIQLTWKNYEKCKKKPSVLICNANYRAHTTPLFKEQKILPLDKLIEFSQIKFMHNFHFRQLPISFTETWKTNAERNPDRMLCNTNDLYIPAHRVDC
jgi:hypothetical protein